MKERLYIVIESNSRRVIDEYTLWSTDAKMKEFCQMKNEFYGGKRSDSGDPTYSCVAYWATPCSIR